MVIGELVWMLSEFHNGHSYPLSIITNLFILLFVYLWALKRGDLRSLFYGNFYDDRMKKYNHCNKMPSLDLSLIE